MQQAGAYRVETRRNSSVSHSWSAVLSFSEDSRLLTVKFQNSSALIATAIRSHEMVRD